MNSQNQFEEFKSQAVLRMEENLSRIEKCLKQLSEDEIWHKPNEASNSMGNLVLHLCGNITQYILSSLGGLEDNRKRDEEFSLSGIYSREELLADISKVVTEAEKVIKSAGAEELMRMRTVQGFRYSGIGIILHVVEHFSYHTGQIAFYTKLLKNKDLGFYSGIDLNKKN